jgi:pyruvate dehydrogenase E1 component alpha subunit
MLTDDFPVLKNVRLEIVDETGRARPGLVPRLTDEELGRMYALMVRTRAADQKALKLQRQGRLGTYASSLGHEACQVGSAFPLRRSDWFFPYFRDLGAYLTLGYPLGRYYEMWTGNEAGMIRPDGVNIFPFTIPVASQITHAAGAGWALRYLKREGAIVCTFGDGATSEGDFHEGLNFAGINAVPGVFVCYNNQWAISTPRSRQTAAPTIAQKALAYGFPGLIVDGNDVLAVHTAVSEALGRARSGKGPTLIEAQTYRMGDHTTSDDATKYRSPEELALWETRDPIRRFQAYLAGRGLWDPAFEKSLADRSAAEIEQAVTEAESLPPASPEDVFFHTYKDMPPALAEQLAELKAGLAEGGR